MFYQLLVVRPYIHILMLHVIRIGATSEEFRQVLSWRREIASIAAEEWYFLDRAHPIYCQVFASELNYR